MEEPRYVYFLSKAGLIRVEISNLEYSPIYKPEFVLRGVFTEIPYGMGIFSHSNMIYLVGGRGRKASIDFDSRVFMFDHNKFEEPDYMEGLEKCPNPIKNLENLPADFISMVFPRAIPAGDKIYMISNSLISSDDDDAQGFDFQHFDTKAKCFEKHPKPPFTGMHNHYGQFLLGSCVYLFVTCGHSIQAFVFDTKSSTWTESEFLGSLFDAQDFPAPIYHRGDVGLSGKSFGDDRFQILVALSYGQPIAYLVRVADLSFGEFPGLGWYPTSCRLLDEVYVPDCDITSSEWFSNLAYFGEGRFCVAYGAIGTAHLLMYVFRIDFESEYDIQILKASDQTSSTLLSSMKFWLPDHLPDLPVVPYLRSDACFLSAASPSKTKIKDKDEEAHLNIKPV